MNCFYCGLPMREPNTPAQPFMKAMGIKRGDKRSRKTMRYARKTDEHLIRKADGGTDAAANIAHAHLYCNSSRGERSVEDHKKWITDTIMDCSHPLAALKVVPVRQEAAE